MIYRVTILRRAQHDVEAIEEYISARSKQGARSWVKRFRDAMASLKKDPLREPLAPENDDFPREVRNITFRTRKGRTYRAIFLVEGQEVRVLRVQGAGQDTLTTDELDV
jgi:plasmid stabilization system protein ParE